MDGRKKEKTSMGRQHFKSNFQRELERSAISQMFFVILIGCVFFGAAIVGMFFWERQMRRKEFLDTAEAVFCDIYDSVTGFLTEKDNQELFFCCARGEGRGNQLRYHLGDFNLQTQVHINLLLTDDKGQVRFSSFQEEDMNLHRMEFNRISGQNAKNSPGRIYDTVYFFSGSTSEYVLLLPLYEEDRYLGCVSAWLTPEDWGRHFLKYQYDTILTDERGNVIYCSNTSLLQDSNVNRYRPDLDGYYEWNNGNRYFVGSRYLKEPGVQIYAFLYSPRTVGYVLLGVAVIIGLGFLWTWMFFRILEAMAAKTSESVGKLVEEIRIIRKKDHQHVISVETGDEIEEIADQINKLVASVNELNRKNLELIQVNSRMEMENLQAQINPHFIYNTLDNIRYLIVQDAAKADELIGRFTHILRYSVNNSKRSASLGEDMEYIQDYLEIQKTRFGKRFTYQVDIAPECRCLKVPKLLLQPLIENSLKYGFKKKASIDVQIRGTVEKGYLVLQVEDDGPGQPRSTLETLRSLLKSEEAATAHNGLLNIHRRIVLEYGENSGLWVDSEENEGFFVTVRLWMGGNRDHV